MRSDVASRAREKRWGRGCVQIEKATEGRLHDSVHPFLMGRRKEVRAGPAVGEFPLIEIFVGHLIPWRQIAITIGIVIEIPLPGLPGRGGVGDKRSRA